MKEKKLFRHKIKGGFGLIGREKKSILLYPKASVMGVKGQDSDHTFFNMEVFLTFQLNQKFSKL